MILFDKEGGIINCDERKKVGVVGVCYIVVSDCLCQIYAIN